MQVRDSVVIVQAQLRVLNSLGLICLTVDVI